jgi:hypothetical protein
MFNLSGWYNTTQWTDTAEVRERAPGAAIYVEMTHTAGWHPHFLPSPSYGTLGNPRTSDHQFYTTAEIAYARGADGMSLFNFVYYRMGHSYDIPITEPPFHVLPKLLDREFLDRRSQYYMLGSSTYHRQVPCRIEAGQSQSFRFDMVPNSRGGQDAGVKPSVSRLRLHAKEPVPEDLIVKAAFNGIPLEPTDDVSRFSGNPFDRMISPMNHRRAWLLPPSILTDGLNDLEITIDGEEPLEVVYLDAWVE